MEISDLSKWGARIAAWSADYLANLRQRPVRAQTQPGDIARQIAPAPPEQPETLETIFADFERQIMPGITHWQHPRFFAYFPANASPPSVIAEYLTATLAAQCMLWQTSPAATELETRDDGLAAADDRPAGRLLGRHPGFRLERHACRAADRARTRAGLGGNQQGLSGQPRLRVYVSEHCHSSIDKACWVAGIGQDNLVKLPASGPLFGSTPRRSNAPSNRDLAAGHQACRDRRLHRRHRRRRDPMTSRHLRRSRALRSLCSCRCRLGRSAP